MLQEFGFSSSDNPSEGISGRSASPRSPKAAMREKAMHGKQFPIQLDEDMDMYGRSSKSGADLGTGSKERFHLDEDDLDVRDLGRQPSRKVRKPPRDEDIIPDIGEDIFEEEVQPRSRSRSKPKAKKPIPPEDSYENEVDDFGQFVDEDQIQEDRRATGDQYLENAAKQRDEIAAKIGNKAGGIKAIIVVVMLIILGFFVIVGMREDKPKETGLVQLPYEEFTGDVSIGGVTYIDTFTITDKIVRKEGYVVTHYFKGNATKFGKQVMFPVSSVVYQNASVGQAVYITYSTTQMNSGGMYTDCLVNVKVVNSRIQ